jgi:hypothetical protein
VVAATFTSSAAAYAAHLFNVKAADDAGSAADACDLRRTIVIGRAAIRLCPVTRLLFEVSSPLQAPLGRALDLLGPAWLSPFIPAWLIPSSERGDGRWVRGLLGFLPTPSGLEPTISGLKGAGMESVEVQARPERLLISHAGVPKAGAVAVSAAVRVARRTRWPSVPILEARSGGLRCLVDP